MYHAKILKGTITKILPWFLWVELDFSQLPGDFGSRLRACDLAQDVVGDVGSDRIRQVGQGQVQDGHLQDQSHAGTEKSK